MIEIVQKDDPVLRQQAQLVSLPELKSAKFKRILKDMSAALASQEDGVALAAPQIRVPLRLFIVSSRVLLKGGKKSSKKRPPDLVFINPTLVRVSKKKKIMDEGCLSIRPLYGNVKRSEKATIRAYDAKGQQVEYGASGLLAQIFQHEIDHLEGILFTDKTTDIFELSNKNGKE